VSEPKLQWKKIDPETIELINQVALRLANQGYAFGALYCARPPHGRAMFLMREQMPLALRIKVLDDIVLDAMAVRDEYKKAQ
jgi:hypothetical protein